MNRGTLAGFNHLCEGESITSTDAALFIIDIDGSCFHLHLIFYKANLDNRYRQMILFKFKVMIYVFINNYGIINIGANQEFTEGHHQGR